MTTSTEITRLPTVERQGWSHDSLIGPGTTTAGRRTTWRVCPAVIVPNLNTAGSGSPRPPREPAVPEPLHVDMLPARLTHTEGQWSAAGRFTHPAVLDPAFVALLNTESAYLLTQDGHEISVTIVPQI